MMSKTTTTHSTQTLSRLELLILQFLHWKEPLYAYEIEKIIEQIHARDWLNIGFSTIYYALNSLYKKGFVTRKKVLQDSAPPRVLYTKTFSGESMLKAEVAKALHSVELPKSNYNQALLSIHLFEKDEILASSRERLTACRQILQEVRHAYEEQHGNMGQYVLLRNMRLLNAEIAWLTDWINIVETCDPSQWETMLQAGKNAHFPRHYHTQNTHL